MGFVKSFHSNPSRITTLATLKATNMPNELRKILAVITGIIIGGTLNFLILLAFARIIPYPLGVKISDTEAIKASLHLFQPKHFLAPFLAHALGTFIGAWVAVKITIDSPYRAALIIGLFFFFAGVTNAYEIGAPLWFIVVDLVGAYLPMAYLALVISGVNRPGKVNH